MTRAAMIVAGVLLATTSAQALELTCQAPIILVGTQSKDTHDTAVGIYIVRTEEDGWEITYRMGNGSEIRRSTQYEIRDTSDAKMNSVARSLPQAVEFPNDRRGQAGEQGQSIGLHRVGLRQGKADDELGGLLPRYPICFHDVAGAIAAAARAGQGLAQMAQRVKPSNET